MKEKETDYWWSPHSREGGIGWVVHSFSLPKISTPPLTETQPKSSVDTVNPEVIHQNPLYHPNHSSGYIKCRYRPLALLFSVADDGASQ